MGLHSNCYHLFFHFFRYFKQTKLTSFQRQLNLYGFRRLTQGADAGAYYHELFLRVRPNLCHRMTRQKVKGTGHKQAADAKTEPNFYEMSIPSSSSVSPPIPRSNEQYNKNMSNQSTRPLQPQQLQYSMNNKPTMPTVSVETSTTRSSIPADSVLDSPGLQCAAHLLQGIASGNIKNNLIIPTSDALSTGGLDDATDPFERYSDDNGNRRSTTFLQPRLSNEYR